MASALVSAYWNLFFPQNSCSIFIYFFVFFKFFFCGGVGCQTNIHYLRELMKFVSITDWYNLYLFWEHGKLLMKMDWWWYEFMKLLLLLAAEQAVYILRFGKGSYFFISHFRPLPFSPFGHLHPLNTPSFSFFSFDFISVLLFFSFYFVIPFRQFLSDSFFYQLPMLLI